ncbi:SAM-dependent methyltransferase [Chitinophaga caeni]|uniref:SAM-dependent methyltransferase n=1 Tax=Chitinophaga caeni TaxID=2029983 RepID=A0A291QXM7_9BACT|nr:class I SAM-dependent methyltransferase [Chitinophaga caeni]ATL48695.1 SAM-dependent methyltransferase [Chitinophaga caeni]
MKDLFSTDAANYATYRPGYPSELFIYLSNLAPAHELAWDAGTGNGQVAARLSSYFKNVIATDISKPQLAAARKVANVQYLEMPSEHTDFKDGSFDLVTVAQAVHWFNFDQFYAEVRRTLKPGGVIAVTGYGLLRSTEAINNAIDELHNEILRDHWEVERKYIDEGYKTIPFPFEEKSTPVFEHSCEWDLNQLLGYLATWSAVQHYIRSEHTNPVSFIEPALKAVFADQEKITFQFPILLRVGTK